MPVETLPELEEEQQTVVKKLPPYHVILHNDEDHSFPYVIAMLQQLFGIPFEKGHKMAHEVHEKGKVIVITTSKEHAELKQEQIHAFGPDKTVPRCKGSMTATIEAAN